MSDTVFSDFEKSTDLGIERNNVDKETKIMKLAEVELQGTSRAKILYFTWSLCSEYGFGTPRA